MQNLRIVSTGTALPPHPMLQESALQRYRHLVPEASAARRALRVFETSGVETRYVSRQVEDYVTPLGFGARNRRYQEDALALGVEAAKVCLERADVPADSIASVIFVTTTGLATPSLDVGMVRTLGLSPRVQRTPVFGLGCAGGVAGIARAASLLGTAPGSRALLVASETCSHCFDPRDDSSLGAVAASLFGDGAAAVLLSRGETDRNARGIQVEGHGSVLLPETEDVMGWEFEDDGFHLVLSRRLSQVIRQEVRPAIETFLRERSLEWSDIHHFILHPGGPRVLDALKQGLELPEEKVASSREVLRDVGNLSSATVLFVLDRFLHAGLPGPGERALMVAPGPGFSFEIVLLAGEAASEDP